MFGIGFTEIILIAVLALLILGPEKFPDMAKKAGRLFAQFQRMGREFKNTVAELDVDDSPKAGSPEADKPEADKEEEPSSDSSPDSSGDSSTNDSNDDKRGEA